MTRRNTFAGAIVAVALAISGVYVVSTVVDQSRVALPRVLLICSATDEAWQRTLVGAREAAKEFGVELRAEAPAPDQTVEQQSELVRKIHPAEFAGIAISPEDAAAQVEVINDLASRTKLVTIGNDAENSKRLCHVGFCQTNAGAKAASMVREGLTRPGQVVLLTTVASTGRNEIVRERLAGFQEKWAEDRDYASKYPAIAVSIDGNDSLLEALADPKLALIVAFDVEAADSVIKATSAWTESKRIPIIALDTDEMILAAIEDGRVWSAVFNDPYEDGYEAIHRLAIYSRDDETSLPGPGGGSIRRSGELVRKADVADVRRRTSDPSKERPGLPNCTCHRGNPTLVCLPINLRDATCTLAHGP